MIIPNRNVSDLGRGRALVLASTAGDIAAAGSLIGYRKAFVGPISSPAKNEAW